MATKAVGSGITGGATLDCPAAVGGPDAHSRKLGAGAPPTPDGDLPPQHQNLGAVNAASFPHEDETSELSDFCNAKHSITQRGARWFLNRFGDRLMPAASP